MQCCIHFCTYYRTCHVHLKLRFRQRFPSPAPMNTLFQWFSILTGSPAPKSWAVGGHDFIFNKSLCNCDLRAGWKSQVHSVTTPRTDLLPQLPSAHAPASQTSRPDPGKSSLTAWHSADCVIPAWKGGATMAPQDAVRTEQARQTTRALQMAAVLTGGKSRLQRGRSRIEAAHPTNITYWP